jgi:hypothetical protein
MNPAKGTVLQFTPDNSGWKAKLNKEAGPHSHTPINIPVVGWATTVTWCKYGTKIDPEGEFETGIEPVVLVDGRTTIPLSELLTDWSPKHTLVELVQPARP